MGDPFRDVSFDFSGRKVIVTGGSRGIGLGLARAFARQGAHISICSRNAEHIGKAVDDLSSFGPVHAEVCDIGDPDQIETYAKAAAAALGGIDVLVNNASGFGRADDEEGWRRAIEVDLMGTLRMCRACLPWLRRSEHAAIVHLGSISAFRPSLKAPAYAAIKAALTQYTQSQSLALIGEGIRVNCVAPGSTETPGHFFEKRRERGDPEYVALLKTQPTGRMGNADDIAGAVMFLASDAARWIVGETILVDGGQWLNRG